MMDTTKLVVGQDVFLHSGDLVGNWAKVVEVTSTSVIAESDPNYGAELLRFDKNGIARDSSDLCNDKGVRGGSIIHLQLRLTKLFASLLLLAALVCPALAQVDQAAGSTDYSTSNIHYSIPVYSKPGFTFTLEVNSHMIENYVTGTGEYWQGDTTITPSTGIEVKMAAQWSSFVSTACNGNGQYTYHNVSIVMPDGSSHPMPSTFQWKAGAPGVLHCYVAPATAFTTDGSYITVVPGAAQTNPWMAYDKHGNSFVATLSTSWAGSGMQFTDTYGNKITGPLVQGIIAAGPYPYVDSTTTGTPSGGVQGQVLSVSNPAYPAPQEVYSYQDGAGATQTVTVNYIAATPGSSFGCQYVQEERGSFSKGNYLPGSITFSSGQPGYSFQYEISSAGHTGRLTGVLLPLGGSTYYSYSGTNGNGGNGGIDCNSAVVPTMTVQTQAGTLAQGTVYTIQNGGFNSNGFLGVTITNNLDNGKTVQTYAAASNPNTTSGSAGAAWPFTGMFLMTSGVYQGATQLSYSTNCYNGSVGSLCTTIAPSAPITQIDSYGLMGSSGNTNHTNTLFDSNGNLVQVKIYDVGASTPTRTVQYYYGKSWTANGTCSGYAGGSYIVDTPCGISVFDGSGTMKSNSKYLHGPNGAITLQGSQLVGTSGAWLSTTYSYNGNGSLNTMTLPNGEVVTEGYDGSCNSLLPTSESNSVNTTLKTYTVYDTGCFGARVVKFTGVDGNFVTKAYLDPFWRPTQFTDQAGNATNIAYDLTTFPNTYVTTAFNGTTLQNVSQVNGLGKVLYKQVSQSYGSGNFDTYSNSYDSSNRLVGVYGPCTAALDTACAGAHATLSYDAMGRTLSAKDASGGTITNTFTGLDVLTTLGPAPANENVKRVQTERNGLGQITSVCEILSTGGTNCGQASSGSGYLTTFSYDTLGHTLSSSQTFNSVTQNRAYTYDALGRMLTLQTPEEGTTSFVYDAFTTPPSGCANFTGSLVQSINPDGSYICNNYDGLGRLVLKTYGGNANTDLSAYSYDAGTNGLGRLTSGWTCQGGAGVFTCPRASAKTLETFAYNATGNIQTYTQWPGGGGNTDTYTQSYDTLGRLQSAVSGNWTLWNAVSYDGEGRTTAINSTINGNHTVPLQTGATYGPFGPTQVTFANGFTQNIGYDNVGHMSSKSTFNGTSCAYSGSSWCLTDSMTWNTNGTLRSLERHTNFDSQSTPSDITATYVYDDAGRLFTTKAVDSLNGGAVSVDQGFSYDRWGNMVNVTSSSGSGSPVPNMYSAGVNSANNQLLDPGVITYDSNGRMTKDEHGNVFTWNVEGKIVARSGQATPYIQDAFNRPTNIPNDRLDYVPGLGTFHGGGYGHMPLPLVGGNTSFFDNTCSCGTPFPGFVHNGYRGDPAGESNYGTQTPPYTAAQSMHHSPFGWEVDVVHGSGVDGLKGFDGDENQQDYLTGNWYTSARTLDSTQGRWDSPDPAHSSSTNLYAYANNNPITFTDPSGLCTEGQDCLNEDVAFNVLGDGYAPFGATPDPNTGLTTGDLFNPAIAYYQLGGGSNGGSTPIPMPGTPTSDSQASSDEATAAANAAAGMASAFSIGGKATGSYLGQTFAITGDNLIGMGHDVANSIGAVSEWMGNHPIITFGVTLGMSMYEGGGAALEDPFYKPCPQCGHEFVEEMGGITNEVVEHTSFRRPGGVLDLHGDEGCLGGCSMYFRLSDATTSNPFGSGAYRISDHTFGLPNGLTPERAASEFGGIRFDPNDNLWIFTTKPVITLYPFSLVK
jgi:RHS repeat-associated protein